MVIPSYLFGDFVLGHRLKMRNGGEAIVVKGIFPYVQGDLAIKQWTANLGDEAEEKRVKREVTLLMESPHKNIIEFLGILIDEESKCIGYIMPYMEKGDLDEIIHNKNYNYDDIYTTKQVKLWVVEICSGLSYLHSKKIIHRDVKPSNILLGRSYDEVKLSDFGVARSLKNLTHGLTAGRGTYLYMAPEVLDEKKYDISADIYSLAITIWEILHRSVPFYHVITKQHELSSTIISGERSQMKNDISEEMSNFLKRCWDTNASKRPAIDEVVDFFTKEAILLTGGWNGDTLDSLLLLVDTRTNWRQLNIKLPYAVYRHGAQFLSNYLYIFGGRIAGDNPINSTYRLSKSLKWEKMADMNQKRSRISNSNVILNNQIWVCGGWNENGQLKSVEMYDPKTKEWKYMKEMNECRVDAAAAVVNGKIFCSGGLGRNSVECYDPSSDVWTQICDMSQEIWRHTAVEMDGNFIVIGGYNPPNCLNSVWALDTTDGNAVWIEKPSMSIPRKDFSIAKVDNEIFVCGGIGGWDNVEILEEWFEDANFSRICSCCCYSNDICKISQMNKMFFFQCSTPLCWHTPV